MDHARKDQAGFFAAGDDFDGEAQRGFGARQEIAGVAGDAEGVVATARTRWGGSCAGVRRSVPAPRWRVRWPRRQGAFRCPVRRPAGRFPETIDLIDLGRTVLLDDASDGEAEAVGPEVHGGQKLIHAARDDGCKSGPIIDTSCDSPRIRVFSYGTGAWRARGVIHVSRFCRTLRLQHVSRKRHDFEVKPHALFMYGIWYDHTPARRALAAESRVVAAQIQRTRAGDGGKSHDSCWSVCATCASSAPTWTSSSRSGFPASRSSSASRPTWLARTA